MTQLFNNKYRIPSARLQNWDYANEAMYFVTICTKKGKNYFGKIIATRQTTILQATEIGKIAHSEWYKSLELRPDMNLELGEFVVMPNHIHGIIMIGANEYNTPRYIPATRT
ncbi:MAG: transposase [Flavobacteriaceae bacterium]|nr:transposase [Flavobacteriaceae bacterium]